MDKLKLKTIRRVAGILTATAALWLLAAGLPEGFWAALGEKAALAAVSLQQAEDAAALLSEKLERLPAAAEGNSTTLPMWQEGQGAEQQPAPEPTAADTAAPVDIPEENGTGGKVVAQQVGGGSVVAGVRVKNNSGTDVNAALSEAVTAALPFQIDFNSPEPQVLIYHTHTTEGYMPYDAGYYNKGDVPREPGYAYNVTLAGDALEAELTAAGITVIHDTTIHDYPSYRGAYDRSLATIEEILAQYPSIKMTIDLHRDGLMANDRDMLKPTVTVNGKKAAQMMVVCGVVSTNSIPHPNRQQNLSLAAHLQGALEETYPGLMRPLSLTASRYNQHVTTGSLLVEVGSEGNTWQEAVYAAHLLGQTLVALWKQNTAYSLSR